MKISLREYIKERVELLLEERSVSEVVENICNKVENSISKTLTSGIEYRTYTFNNEKDNEIIVHSFQVGTFTLENVERIKEINVTIYNFKSKEDLSVFTRNTQYFDCKYEYKDNTIELYCPAINNVLYRPFLRRLLSHEFKHVYRVLNFNFEPSKLYNSDYYLTKTINKNDANYKVAYLLYWLYSDEIYANCQALYNECEMKKLFTVNDISYNSDVYNEFKIIKKWYEEMVNTEKTYKPQLFLNIPFRKILNYIRKQIRYCQTKFDKVISYIVDKHQFNENFNVKGELPIMKI